MEKSGVQISIVVENDAQISFVDLLIPCLFVCYRKTIGFEVTEDYVTMNDGKSDEVEMQLSPKSKKKEISRGE